MHVHIRPAEAGDLPRLLELYRALDTDAEPLLGIERARHIFHELRADPNHCIYVAEGAQGEVMGTFALIFIGGLAHGARQLAVVEDVVVAAQARGQGVGRTMMHFAMERCADRGCYKLSLSSHVRRESAHRFYEKLGFAKHGYSFLTAQTGTDTSPR